MLKPFIICSFCLLMLVMPAQAQRKGSHDARAAVQSFFALLKAKKYAELYEYLPSEMQKRLTREQAVQSLQRLDDFILIEKMEIGRVQQRQTSSGEFAVIDTTLYGKLQRPAEVEGQKVEAGKVVVQQYLFREGTQWKVATASSGVRSQFLKRYPEFTQGFQLTQPQFFVKQNGQWKLFNPFTRSR